MDEIPHDPASAGTLDRPPGVDPATTDGGHSSAAVLSLKQAMRRARFDDAERSSAVADLRAARLGRLEVLREALRPLLAQIPDDVDCFDVGIMPGSDPRLFIDMIAFVEMARDPRVYRFVQDTRNGRVKLAESESVPVLVEAATHYIARRLLERDKALAADDPPVPDAIHSGALAGRAATLRANVLTHEEPAAGHRLAPGRVLALAFSFIIDVLGSLAFFSLLAFGAWVVWANLRH